MHRAEATGECRAFACSQDCAQEAEACKTTSKGMSYRGQRPDAYRRRHAAAHSETVEQDAPDRVAHHVGYGKTGDDEAVLFGVQVRFG